MLALDVHAVVRDCLRARTLHLAAAAAVLAMVWLTMPVPPPAQAGGWSAWLVRRPDGFSLQEPNLGAVRDAQEVLGRLEARWVVRTRSAGFLAWTWRVKDEVDVEFTPESRAGLSAEAEALLQDAEARRALIAESLDRQASGLALGRTLVRGGRNERLFWPGIASTAAVVLMLACLGGAVVINLRR